MSSIQTSRYVDYLPMGVEHDPIMFRFDTECPVPLVRYEDPQIETQIQMNFPTSDNYTYFWLTEVEIYFSENPEDLSYNQREDYLLNLNYTDQLPTSSVFNLSLQFEWPLMISDTDLLYFRYGCKITYTYNETIHDIEYQQTQKNGPINYDDKKVEFTPLGGFLLGLGVSLITIPISIFFTKRKRFPQAAS